MGMHSSQSQEEADIERAIQLSLEEEERRKAREHAENDRVLREQQDQDYEASLKRDMQKDKERRTESSSSGSKRRGSKRKLQERSSREAFDLTGSSTKDVVMESSSVSSAAP